MTIQGMISRFGVSVNVTRRNAGTYVNGVWVAGSVSSFSTMAAVQPLTGKDLEFLPSGERTTETLKMYCADEIKTAADDANGEPDIVQFDGKTYRVVTVQKWIDANLPFWKSTLVRVPQ